ncbi:MAG: alpha-1,2-fucosyltransferase [Bacteroidaceae bacterium]|nr:alpha-1,2-fucosyltransferase [Bacteroidaceae bacterium]
MKRELFFLDGGLGNQMFQYAFANKEEQGGHQVTCCYGLLEKRKTHNGYELDRVFQGIKAKRMIVATYMVRVLYYLIFIYKLSFCKKILNLLSWDFIMTEEEMDASTSKNLFVVGYWASWMNVRDVSIFKFREDDLSGETKEIQQGTVSSNSISLHVRRGDYLSPNNQWLFGGICTTKYYEQAIQYICEHVQNPVFYVFSNDIPWVRENLNIPNAVYVTHNQGADSWQDMYLMSKCKHHIIANSTFSWWGAYLHQDKQKIVICPPKLTNVEGGSPNLFPEEWIKIEG